MVDCFDERRFANLDGDRPLPSGLTRGRFFEDGAGLIRLQLV